MSDTDLSRPVDLPEPEVPQRRPLAENLWLRLLNTVLIAILFSLLQTVMTVLTLIQFVLVLANRRQPNANIAQLGRSLGLWCGRAARYLTADTEDKPWPWRPLD
ncbi:DUF4389 domain-containing protein [Rubellimicrobium roseum]|uniref:DUF4389 domain-containing protein n=1 Tax=Rubellimicrobium roseum TaxID=687525 RepID=A0A5C4NAY9_9RHOB|nr:DUF4389 domain-containing protein [Rubellimicrobium roseum]TNC70883.1 DUF4389 domain-containing protein [Rubellimicrobium roseum]